MKKDEMPWGHFWILIIYLAIFFATVSSCSSLQAVNKSLNEIKEKVK